MSTPRSFRRRILLTAPTNSMQSAGRTWNGTSRLVDRMPSGRCSMLGTKRASHNMIVQPRDLQLLRELGVMRVLDREQARIVAGFQSTTRANTRLLALTRAGLLRRFFLGSGGGRKALYRSEEHTS